MNHDHDLVFLVVGVLILIGIRLWRIHREDKSRSNYHASWMD